MLGWYVRRLASRALQSTSFESPFGGRLEGGGREGGRGVGGEENEKDEMTEGGRE